MRMSNDGMKRVTLMLTIAIVVCLSVASLGGVVDAPWLAYSWYLGLFGILSLIVLTALQGMHWLLEAGVRRYHRMMLHWGGEAHGH